MGNSTSSVMKVNASVVNKQVYETLTKNTSEVNQSVVGTQILTLKNAILMCTADISQEMTTSVTALQTMTTSVQANVVSTIMTSIEEQAKNSLAAKNGAGAVANSTEAFTEAKESVANDLNIKLSVENLNKTIQTINTTQLLDSSNVIIDPCGTQYLDKVGPALGQTIIECKMSPANKCDFSQNMATTLLAQQVTGTVMEILAKNTAVSNLVSIVESNVVAENTGFLQDLFAGLTNLVGGFGIATILPSIISCIICILLIVGIVMLGKSPAGQAAITKGTNVAAARAGGGFK